MIRTIPVTEHNSTKNCNKFRKMSGKPTDEEDARKNCLGIGSPVRCRKCGEKLFTSDFLVAAHGKPLTLSSNEFVPAVNSAQQQNNSKRMNSPSCSKTIDCDNSQWFLDVDNCPSWITTALEMHSFTKGKLLCPKCSGRIGSFDFLTAVNCLCLEYVLPSVRIAKSRVDLMIRGPVAVVGTEKPRAALQTETFQPHTMSSHSSITQAVEERSEDNRESSVLNNGNTLNNSESELNTSDEPSYEMVNHSSNVIDENPYHVLVENNTESPANAGSTEAGPTEEEQQESDIDDLTCPVCLELFYQPHTCQPCRHTFCGPCLQRLRASTTFRTKCPLCREVIWKCLPDSGLSKSVQECFPVQYKSRQKLEKKHKRKLPPLPGLSNVPLRLLSGRFARENRHINTLTILSGTCFVIMLMVLGFTVFALTVGVFLWYLTEIAMDVFIDIFLEIHNFFDHIYQALVIFCIEGKVPENMSLLLVESVKKMFTGFARLKNSTELFLSEDDGYYAYGHGKMRQMGQEVMTSTQRLLYKMTQSGVANYLIIGIIISYLMYRLAKYRQHQLLQQQQQREIND